MRHVLRDQSNPAHCVGRILRGICWYKSAEVTDVQLRYTLACGDICNRISFQYHGVLELLHLLKSSPFTTTHPKDIQPTYITSKRHWKAHQYLFPVYLHTAGFSRVVPLRSMYSTGHPSPASSANSKNHYASGINYELEFDE